MKFRVVSIIALMTLAVVAAGRPAFAQAPPQTVDISDPQDGGKLMVFVGDTVEVRLHSTPGTGYSWQVIQVDKNVLSQRKAPVFVPPPQNFPGAQGHLVFDFLAATPGVSTLQLAYARPWEKGTAPARTFTIDVTVRPASDRFMPQH